MNFGDIKNQPDIPSIGNGLILRIKVEESINQKSVNCFRCPRHGM